jgi:hypothetical protein
VLRPAGEPDAANSLVGLMDEQPPASVLPPRPPGSRILVVNDDAGFTVVIPPQVSRVVVWMFVLAGVSWLLSFVYLGLFFWAAFYTPRYWEAPSVFYPLCMVIYQILYGYWLLRRAVSWRNQWTCLTVQGDELEVRYCGLKRESRVRWPCTKIGRVYVETLNRRTASLGIQVVGVDRINLSNASQAEWEWVAALLRQALNRNATPRQTSDANGNSGVDEIISSTSQVRRP